MTTLELSLLIAVIVLFSWASWLTLALYHGSYSYDELVREWETLTANWTEHIRSKKKHADELWSANMSLHNAIHKMEFEQRNLRRQLAELRRFRNLKERTKLP